MTFLGKLLVMLVTVMSLAMLTWATGVYSHRLNWFPPESVGGEKVKGRINELKDEIRVQLDASREADELWMKNQARLDDLQRIRDFRAQYYADLLNMVKTGQFQGQPVSPAVMKLVRNEDPLTPMLFGPPIPPQGQPGRPVEVGPDIDLNGTPDPLLPIEAYRVQIKARQEALGNAQAQVAKLIMEQETLTNMIIDEPGEKGLLTLIQEQFDIAQASKRQQDYLQPYITNRRAEVAQVRRRQNSLQARVEEVKRYLGTLTSKPE